MRSKASPDLTFSSIASNKFWVIRSTEGRMPSIFWRLKALATSERNRVCLGGSLSKIESACSQLKISHSNSGVFGAKIRPNDLLRKTSLASPCLAAKKTCIPSCQMGPSPKRSCFRAGYGSAINLGSLKFNSELLIFRKKSFHTQV